MHEVNDHKDVDQLIFAYTKAGWMSSNVSQQIRMVVFSCRVFQKFTKLVRRPDNFVKSMFVQWGGPVRLEEFWFQVCVMDCW